MKNFRFYIIFFIIILIWALVFLSGNLKKKNMNTTNNFSQISKEEFKIELEDRSSILLDVRTPEELPIYWKIRDNQILIDINNKNFVSEIAKLDKSKKYLIYCWHWNRSQVARDYMKEQGFSYVKDLRWGIDIWN